MTVDKEITAGDIFLIKSPSQSDIPGVRISRRIIGPEGDDAGAPSMTYSFIPANIRKSEIIGHCIPWPDSTANILEHFMEYR